MKSTCLQFIDLKNVLESIQQECDLHNMKKLKTETFFSFIEVRQLFNVLFNRLH